jgi:methylated-DNA-[protein]-cysteine S-methyltransferase
MAEATPKISPFARAVYDALGRVPAGRVTTYKLLARAVGCRSAQAVGQALRRNPFAPEVPCHRVVRSDLTLGGFAGATAGEAPARKRELLEAEGVPVIEGRIAESARVIAPPGPPGRESAFG